ncbi:unnamed protein product [Prunus brigantina]
MISPQYLRPCFLRPSASAYNTAVARPRRFCLCSFFRC